MNRKDVEAARDLAARFVEASDELLATPHKTWNADAQAYRERPWRETWLIAGKASGAHRRLSLDLTRALAHMRRRS